MSIKVVLFFWVSSTCFAATQPDVPADLMGVYWGAFDPVTEAHQAIVYSALRDIPLKKILVIVNNHSYKKYSLSLEERMMRLRKAFSSIESDRLELLWQDDKRPLDYEALKKQISQPLCAIAGYDSYKAWVKYASIQERAKYSCIAVVPRGEEIPELFDGSAFLLPIDAKYRHLSSTQVRREADVD